jgi:hypothetical protein
MRTASPIGSITVAIIAVAVASSGGECFSQTGISTANAPSPKSPTTLVVAGEPQEQRRFSQPGHGPDGTDIIMVSFPPRGMSCPDSRGIDRQRASVDCDAGFSVVGLACFSAQSAKSPGLKNTRLPIRTTGISPLAAMDRSMFSEIPPRAVRAVGTSTRSGCGVGPVPERSGTSGTAHRLASRGSVRECLMDCVKVE